MSAAVARSETAQSAAITTPAPAKRAAVAKLAGASSGRSMPRAPRHVDRVKSPTPVRFIDDSSVAVMDAWSGEGTVGSPATQSLKPPRMSRARSKTSSFDVR